MKSDQKITIKTIAQTFGVAESTVSRAFNPNSRISDSMRQQILAYAKQHHYAPNKAAASLRMKDLNIGFLCATTDPPYAYAMDEFERGIQDAYTAHSNLKLHLHRKTITYSIHMPHTKTAELQNILDDWKEFDGIIICGFHDMADIELLNTFAERGKPIVLLQNNQPQIHCLFVSCLDATASSMMAAEYLENCLKKAPHKQVALFTGDRSSWLHSEAERIFRNAEKSGAFHLVASYDMKDSSELLLQQVTDLYQTRAQHPDAIYISSGISYELCEYIKENNLQNETILVAFDVSPQISQYLKDGIVTATINQDLYNQAKNAFTGLVDYLTGYNTVDTVFSPVPTLVMKSNLEYYLKQDPTD